MPPFITLSTRPSLGVWHQRFSQLLDATETDRANLTPSLTPNRHDSVGKFEDDQETIYNSDITLSATNTPQKVVKNDKKMDEVNKDKRLFITLRFSLDKSVKLNEPQSSGLAPQEKKRRTSGPRQATKALRDQSHLAKRPAVASSQAPASKLDKHTRPVDRSGNHGYSTRSRAPAGGTKCLPKSAVTSPQYTCPHQRGPGLHITGFSRSSNVSESCHCLGNASRVSDSTKSFRTEGDTLYLGSQSTIPLPVQIPKNEGEGAKAAWRRLFPGDGELVDWLGRWQEKMMWKHEEGGKWVVRTAETPFIPVELDNMRKKRYE